MAQKNQTGHLQGLSEAYALAFGAWGSASAPGGGFTVFGTGQAGVLNPAWNVASPPAEFAALNTPASLINAYGFPASDTLAPQFPQGLIGWAGVGAGTLDQAYGFRREAIALDFYFKQAFSTILWRPVTGGLTKIRPELHAWYGTNAAGLSRISTPADQVLPPRPLDGISRVETVFDLATLSNNINAFPSANGGTNRWRGRGLAFTPFERDGSADGVDGSNVGGVLRMRMLDPGKLRGVVVDPLYARGGEPSRSVAFDLCGISGVGGTSDAALAAQIRACVADQVDENGNPLDPMLLIHIIEGGNDAGDTGAKTDGKLTGPTTYLQAGRSLLSTTGAFQSAVEVSGQAGNTAQGYANNTLTIIRRYRYVWTQVLGYKRANLFFCVGAYHPQPATVPQFGFVGTTMPVNGWPLVQADDPDQIFFVDGYKIASPAELGIIDGGTGTATDDPHKVNTTATPFTAVVGVPHYNGTDVSHMTEIGYRSFGRVVVEAIKDACELNGLYGTASANTPAATARAKGGGMKDAREAVRVHGAVTAAATPAAPAATVSVTDHGENAVRAALAAALGGVAGSVYVAHDRLPVEAERVVYVGAAATTGHTAGAACQFDLYAVYPGPVGAVYVRKAADVDFTFPSPAVVAGTIPATAIDGGDGARPALTAAVSVAVTADASFTGEGQGGTAAAINTEPAEVRVGLPEGAIGLLVAPSAGAGIGAGQSVRAMTRRAWE